jgi:glyoxylase-like metal-dependent hydrolase (beta-lactamase superfamily II)
MNNGENMGIVVKDSNIQIERLELGPFATNAYIIICQQTRDSVLIDAPSGANTIMERLKGTNTKYILLTHNHMDHTGALSELHAKLKVPLAVHTADNKNLPSLPEMILNDGDVIVFGKVRMVVLHTPGHTPGSLCFKIGNYLLSGDTIFPGGPGKTGSPADFKTIIKYITGKIFVLPDDTHLYPGHGDSTNVKEAKSEFAVFSARNHDPKLCGDVLWLSS